MYIDSIERQIERIFTKRKVTDSDRIAMYFLYFNTYMPNNIMDIYDIAFMLHVDKFSVSRCIDCIHKYGPAYIVYEVTWHQLVAKYCTYIDLEIHIDDIILLGNKYEIQNLTQRQFAIAIIIMYYKFNPYIAYLLSRIAYFKVSSIINYGRRIRLKINDQI